MRSLHAVVRIMAESNILGCIVLLDRASLTALKKKKGRQPPVPWPLGRLTAKSPAHCGV